MSDIYQNLSACPYLSHETKNSKGDKHAWYTTLFIVKWVFCPSFERLLLHVSDWSVFRWNPSSFDWLTHRFHQIPIQTVIKHWSLNGPAYSWEVFKDSQIGGQVRYAGWCCVHLIHTHTHTHIEVTHSFYDTVLLKAGAQVFLSL